MPFVIEFDGVPDVVNTTEYLLSCLFTIVDSPSALTTRRLRAKLYIDDVEIPFKSATWNVDNSQPWGSLSVVGADLGDRNSFTRTTLIKLETEEFLSGSWSTIKTYCEGSVLATLEYNIQNTDDRPDDSFSITVLPLLRQRLDITPEQLVVLYDNTKTTVDEDSLETVPNIDGTDGTVTVTPLAGMTLASVLNYVATALGFSGYKTNINDSQWPLTRVDFPAGQPFWATVAGIIGNHEPKLSIDADNDLVIRDGTLTNYITSRAMGTSKWKTVKLNKTIERFKGCYLTYQLNESDSDYWAFNVRHTSQWFEGVVNQYPKIESEIWEQKFYKLGFATPVNIRNLKEYHFTYINNSTAIAATGEVFSYLNGQMIRRDKREFGLMKAPQAWITAQSGIPGPLAGFSASFGGPEEAYTSASDATWTEAVVLTRTERETFSYLSHPFQADSVYLAEHDHWVKGLITVDSDNPQLDEDFEQPLARAQESGNLVEGQGSRYGTTDYKGESQRVLANRKVMIRQRGNTPLNSTAGIQYQDGEDVRVGDVDVPLIRPVTKSVYVTEGGDATASLWRPIHAGEAPLIIAQPLCIRLNKRQDFPGGIAGELPTYDETMEIGAVIDAQVDGRTSTSLGIYEVTGYTDIFSEGQILTSVVTKQIG